MQHLENYVDQLTSSGGPGLRRIPCPVLSHAKMGKQLLEKQSLGVTEFKEDQA